jgi:NDP-4-keto-2,6-dideoxyhexose 3-C-methyltransferase
MRELFTLGDLYVSDFIQENTASCDVGKKIEMKMVWDDKISAPRLEKTTPPELMYGKYWYRSGTNKTMHSALSDVVNYVIKNFELHKGDVWLDIACNDGTLLSYVPKHCTRIGVDPADNSFLSESKKHADVVVQDYFSASTYSKTTDKRAKVITTIAMFYDLDNPFQFLKDVYSALDDDGLFVLQLSYTPLMIKQLAFDNICHEHVYYYSLQSIKHLLQIEGFDVVDCALNEVNGGSFRIAAMKHDADKTKFGAAPYRDVCDYRINSYLEFENIHHYNEPEIWDDFFEKLQSLKQQTNDFITKKIAAGKTVWGYGASTKGNTLLQYFGLDKTMIAGIAERSASKFGLKTIGSEIPIYSEEDMRKANPDYLLVLPWAFIDEFVRREQPFLLNGGRFIVPCPKFEII